MSEERKGHAKITVEMELNEEMMSLIKEAITKMPNRMANMVRENI
jgi:hypothetical protein